MTTTLEPADRAYLRQFLEYHFDLEELKTLAFDLGADYELFAHSTTRSLSRELIGYFGRRDQLHSLVSQVITQRPNEALVQLLAKLPATASRVKVQIILSQDLMPKASLLLDGLAQELEVGRDQVALIAAAAGSILLLIGVTYNAAPLSALSEIHGSCSNRYQIASVVLYDSLDQIQQQIWRLVAVEYPPIRQDDRLCPAVLWSEAEDRFRRVAYDPQYSFELFREAIVDRSQRAWELIYALYSPQVAAWAKQDSELSSAGEDVRYFVNRAFEKMWLALTPERFGRFADMSSLLRYLQMCVHGAIIDATRANVQSIVDIQDERLDGEDESSVQRRTR